MSHWVVENRERVSIQIPAFKNRKGRTEVITKAYVSVSGGNSSFRGKPGGIRDWAQG